MTKLCCAGEGDLPLSTLSFSAAEVEIVVVAHTAVESLFLMVPVVPTKVTEENQHEAENG